MLALEGVVYVTLEKQKGCGLYQLDLIQPYGYYYYCFLSLNRHYHT